MQEARREARGGKAGAGRTLLHTCCGPCASACVPPLKEGGGEVTMFFANSNIDTREEFERRLGAAEKLAAVEGVRLVALPYDHGEWLREVAAGCEHEPEQGARCERCFRYNLAKTAEYAKAHGYDGFTTSLTVSPHKVTELVFAAACEAESRVSGVRSGPSDSDVAPRFLPWNFKAHGGYGRSVRRAQELGLYRQDYCGCEFSRARWTVHSKRETESTNLDAREGRHRDVFTADHQTAGRGRLDHRWLSPPGENLAMSAVLSVEGMEAGQVATLPLVAGLAVAEALRGLSGRVGVPPPGRAMEPWLKWPNDILVGGRKIAGILCERHGDNVIVGIGVNVRQRTWPDELVGRVTSVLQETGRQWKVAQVRNAVLGQLGKWYGVWRERGFAAIHRELASIDLLKGREIAVRQTDDDAVPLVGVCGGIRPDGSLDVGGTAVYAGEAHVERLGV